jgi:hypothetical protein
MAGRPRKQDDTVENAVNNLTLTSEENAIRQRVLSDDDGWTGITEESMEDFSLMADPFELPPEAKELFDRGELAFRWAEMSTKRIDELRNAPVPMKWWIANATSVPALAKYCDPVHGGIQKLDQILFVKPFWMLQKVRDAKKELADIQSEGGNLKKKNQQKVDEAGSQWVAGENAKIQDGDFFMDEGSEHLSESESSEDLGDLVVNE